MTLPIVGASGVVIGADIAPGMLTGARGRLDDPYFGRSPLTAKCYRSKMEVLTPSSANSACSFSRTPLSD